MAGCPCAHNPVDASAATLRAINSLYFTFNLLGLLSPVLLIPRTALYGVRDSWRSAGPSKPPLWRKM